MKAKTFKNIYDFAKSNNPNTILPIVDEKEFEGLDAFQRANKIRAGYYCAIEKVRGRITFRVLFEEYDMLNITFKLSALNQVQISDCDDFGDSKSSPVYMLPMDTKIKEALKLPIIRKRAILLLLEFFG